MSLKVGERIPEVSVMTMIEDGVVSVLNLEKPGEFLVSDAQTMLNLL